MTKKEQKIVFNGEFTKTIRIALKSRRKKLGLSYSSLGELLSVSWVTVRNWEEGIVLRCHYRCINEINRFLNGEYDIYAFDKRLRFIFEIAREKNSVAECKAKYGEMLSYRGVFAKLVRLFDYLNGERDAQVKLIENIRLATRRAAEAFSKCECTN